MRVLLPKRYLKGIIAFLLFLIGTVALVGGTLPASYQQKLGLPFTGSILAELFHTQTANPFAVTATVTTDKQDYPIGATVVISGSGWAPGETVTLQVTDNLSATDPNQVAHAPWDVVADSNGNISSTWVVDEDANALTLTLTAVGHTSGSQAQTTFTDANPSANLDQCANDSAPSPSTDGCNSNANQWVNGNVNGAKANYFEGDSLPYRMTFDNLSLSSHVVIIEWDTTKGDKHALDYITTFNQTVANANPCLGITGCGSGSFSATTKPIPADPQVTGAGVTPIAGNLTMYGGSISAIRAPTAVELPGCTLANTSGSYCYSTGTGFSGDKSAAIAVEFTASVANPVLAWAGHISTRKDWGFQNSAIAVSGSPYHTRLIDLDGSGGNQDRSLSADAVFFPVTLTVIKETNPDDAPSKQFDYTTTGPDLSNFSLTPPNGTTPVQKSFTLNDTSTRTVTESDPHLTLPKFNYTSLNCVEVDGGLGTGGFTVTDATRSVSFTPKEGQTITCTYVNTEDKKANDGRIIVDKVTNPTADPTLFTFTSDFSGTFKLADQSTPLDSGLILPVNPSSGDGSYSVSEAAVADWSLTGKTCTSDSGFSAQDPSKIFLHAGETITCTFTNTKLTAGLSVTKTPSVTDICNGSNTSVKYTYVVKNTGTADLTGVNLVDDNGTPGNPGDDIDVDGGAGFSLAAGASQTFTNTRSLNGTVTNKVVATGSTAGGQSASANASATITGHDCTISITKTPSTTDVCNGSTVSYTIKVTNNSDKFSWTGSVVDDILGTLSASTTLAPGGSKTFTPSGSITGTVKNTATADGKFDDPATASAKASASATVTGHVCTISITKTPSTTDVCNGSTVSYTIKVTNNSDKFSWTGSVVDDILGSLSASTTLTPGGSATFTPSGSVTGTVKNTATADGKFDDGSATSAKASASATVTGHVCTISITKTPRTTEVCNGSTVTYDIKVTNNSDKFSWTGSVIDDVLGTLNASLTLAAGGSQTFTPSGSITGTVKNTATADGKFDDGSATSAKASASATVTGHVCTISITKSPSVTNFCNGTSVTYTIKVTNNSDKFKWTGSLVDDKLGTLSASFSLAAGGSQTFTPAAAISGTVKNTATADGTFDDGSATSAKASADATVNGHVCQIIVKKVTDPTTATDKFTFTGDLSGSLGNGDSTSKNVLAGIYKTTETVLSGWDLTKISCDTGASGSGSTATYTIAANATVNQIISCTFTNTERGKAKVIKTFNGSSSDFGGNTFTFQLRSGASAASAGTILETGTASAGNNTINFTTQLVPGTTYQLCEQMLPGFMTTLGPPLYSVFNPSGDNSVVCTDFTVNPGETKSFNIDNQPPPGGMALTIGFWKNWASCSKSNGGQKPVLDKALLAAANAGHPITEGLLVLDPNVLGAATACQDAVNLLNKTPINGSKKSASDPIFNMVAQLVAADLNVAAGAGVSVSAAAAINCAHKLLNDIAFNGNTYNKLTAAQLAAANCLATALDQYNNNKPVQACTCP